MGGGIVCLVAPSELRLEEPEPETLFAGAYAVARLEAAAECHFHGLVRGRRQYSPAPRI
jgi:hypothetical protein